jgi:hypothetical protein
LQQEIFSSNQRYLPLDLARQKPGGYGYMLGMGVHTEKPSHQQFVIFIALTVKVRGKRNIFKDFRGVLHADAYSGYDQLYQNQNNPGAEITEARCWSHTRQKFYEITVVYDKASISISILEQISEMYKIESEIRGLDHGERMKY